MYNANIKSTQSKWSHDHQVSILHVCLVTRPNSPGACFLLMEHAKLHIKRISTRAQGLSNLVMKSHGMEALCMTLGWISAGLNVSVAAVNTFIHVFLLCTYVSVYRVISPSEHRLQTHTNIYTPCNSLKKVDYKMYVGMGLSFPV